MQFLGFYTHLQQHNPKQGLSYEFETEGATCYIEWALGVPVSIKNLKSAGARGDVQNISGCQVPTAPVLTQAF